jgi:hypothetical protein
VPAISRNGEPRTLAARIEGVDWTHASAELDEQGAAVLGDLLTPLECRSVIELYDDPSRFRSRVDMSRHGYGRGEYRYLDYPLPAPIDALRSQLYPRLVPIANRWSAALGTGVTYPEDHATYLDECHRAGQTRPTPLLLKYGAGDYNRLHQDLYGALVFPLQVAILLSDPERDFGGGEFVMTEQRPRMQSRPMVVPLGQGDAVVFAVSHRPASGPRGVHRVNLRHGVSRVREGERLTLGLIFHDAA